LTVGDLTLTPQSQVLTIRLPFGGFVWHRPTAVLVERAGRVDRVRIVDVTRLVEVGLLGLSIVFVVLSVAARQCKEAGSWPKR
jgi:hypothetical protein